MTVASVAEGVRASHPPRRSITVPPVENLAFSAIMADPATPAHGAGQAPATAPATAPAPAPAPANGGKLAGPPALFTAGFDETGKTFRMDRFAEALKTRTAEFTETMNRRFLLAGVDTDIPVTLDVNGDGTIAVSGDHPDKAKIERLFAEDPEFANRYREIASGHNMLATGHVATRYAIALDDAKNDEERDRVVRRYEAVFRQLEKVSGQMTLSGGQLSSASMDMAAAFLKMPGWALG